MTLNPAQDKFLLKRQLTSSPGFAKTAPYPPCTVTHSRSAYRRVHGFCPVLCRVTLTPTTAWPLAQIFLAQRLSLRTVVYILHLDKIISALNNEMPLARQATSLPAHIYMILLTKYQYYTLPWLASH